jgi:hypothetical protein
VRGGSRVADVLGRTRVGLVLSMSLCWVVRQRILEDPRGLESSRIDKAAVRGRDGGEGSGRGLGGQGLGAQVLQFFSQGGDVVLLGDADLLGRVADFLGLGLLGGYLGHVDAAQVVAEHQLGPEDVEVLAGGGLELLELVVRGHPRHAAVGLEGVLAVGHPGHGLVAGVGGQVPLHEPGLHLADLPLLAGGDVVAQGADVIAAAQAVGEHGHLHGLGVVEAHVAGEAGVDRVVAGLTECRDEVTDGGAGHQQEDGDEHAQGQACSSRELREHDRISCPAAGWLRRPYRGRAAWCRSR